MDLLIIAIKLCRFGITIDNGMEDGIDGIMSSFYICIGLVCDKYSTARAWSHIYIKGLTVLTVQYPAAGGWSLIFI